MPENPNCFPMLDLLLFVTTILFMAFSVLLVRRILRLRIKISKMRKKIAEQERFLKTKKDSHTKFLKPYESDTAKSIILSVNAQHEVTYMNDFAEELFGFSKQELLNHNVFDTIYLENDKDETLQENIIDRILNNPTMYMEHESENVKKNGERVWISWTNRVVYDDDNQPVEIRSVGFDITKRKQLEKELRNLSVQDQTTGVYNRQSFLDMCVLELKRAIRYKRNLSLMVLKLDFFHTIEEERYFTDEILKDAVFICQKSIRESDIIGRLSELEFAILLPETPIENALFLAEQLKQKIQEKNIKHKNEFFIGATFGVSEKTRTDDTIDSILSNAIQSLNNENQKSHAKGRQNKGA